MYLEEQLNTIISLLQEMTAEFARLRGPDLPLHISMTMPGSNGQKPTTTGSNSAPTVSKVSPSTLAPATPSAPFELNKKHSQQAAPSTPAEKEPMTEEEEKIVVPEIPTSKATTPKVAEKVTREQVQEQARQLLKLPSGKAKLGDVLDAWANKKGAKLSDIDPMAMQDPLIWARITLDLQSAMKK